MAHGYQPTGEQAQVQDYLQLLKSGRSLRADSVSSSIVSFPSFHIVLAILPMIALWPTPESLSNVRVGRNGFYLNDYDGMALWD